MAHPDRHANRHGADEFSEHFLQFDNAALRITTLFMELLERQFPVEDLTAPL